MNILFIFFSFKYPVLMLAITIRSSWMFHLVLCCHLIAMVFMFTTFHHQCTSRWVGGCELNSNKCAYHSRGSLVASVIHFISTQRVSHSITMRVIHSLTIAPLHCQLNSTGFLHSPLPSSYITPTSAPH